MTCGICKTLYPEIQQATDELCLECRQEGLGEGACEPAEFVEELFQRDIWRELTESPQRGCEV